MMPMGQPVMGTPAPMAQGAPGAAGQFVPIAPAGAAQGAAASVGSAIGGMFGFLQRAALKPKTPAWPKSTPSLIGVTPRRLRQRREPEAAIVLQQEAEQTDIDMACPCACAGEGADSPYM